jgi:hypothetical protein
MSDRQILHGPSFLLGLLVLLLTLPSGHVYAADSQGCESGGFTVLGRSAPQTTTVPASALGSSFLVQGRYTQFEVDSATLGIRNYAMTGALNPLDLTGATLTPVWASKTPDHRGLTLTSGLALTLGLDASISLQRTGPGLSMKITALDCATGGIFQMEPERTDGTPTLFTHTLAPSAFYFDNRNFRNEEGDFVPFKDTTVEVGSRVNFGNDVSHKFVGRDSPQVATLRPESSCPNVIVTRFPPPDATDTVLHCGGVSRWDVASGGRMGLVMGEDSVEVAPPASVCTHQCMAQDRVRGRSTVLGFPFPVAQADRLKPRSPTN